MQLDLQPAPVTSGVAQIAQLRSVALDGRPVPERPRATVVDV